MTWGCLHSNDLIEIEQIVEPHLDAAADELLSRWSGIDPQLIILYWICKKKQLRPPSWWPLHAKNPFICSELKPWARAPTDTCYSTKTSTVIRPPDNKVPVSLRTTPSPVAWTPFQEALGKRDEEWRNESRAEPNSCAEVASPRFCRPGTSPTVEPPTPYGGSRPESPALYSWNNPHGVPGTNYTPLPDSPAWSAKEPETKYAQPSARVARPLSAGFLVTPMPRESKWPGPTNHPARRPYSRPPSSVAVSRAADHIVQQLST